MEKKTHVYDVYKYHPTIVIIMTCVIQQKNVSVVLIFRNSVRVLSDVKFVLCTQLR